MNSFVEILIYFVCLCLFVCVYWLTSTILEWFDNIEYTKERSDKK